MAGLSSITDVWKNIKEIDLRPIRQDALQGVKLAIAGAPGSGRTALAEQLRRDPSHLGMVAPTPVLTLDLDSTRLAEATEQADLIILLLDARAEDHDREKDLAKSWANADKKVLVFVNQFTLPGSTKVLGPWVNWGQQRVVYGSVEDTDFLHKEFAPAVIGLLPDQLLALGRNFPLFRVPIAHHLINETSFTNATYALSSGLAAIVPVFNIPLNVADMVVLSKAQAFMVYRLGLALGLSTEWQDYVSEFGSVLGGGFLWRQLARSLVGLIPAWGIVPKVAIAYAGTYVVGNVVLQWYLTGRHITKKQMRELYSQAFARGKIFARYLAQRMPRPRLGRRRKPAELPAPKEKQACTNCGRISDADAAFCQYCGHRFEPNRTATASDQEIGGAKAGQ